MAIGAAFLVSPTGSFNCFNIASLISDSDGSAAAAEHAIKVIAAAAARATLRRVLVWDI
jgi:hypothetical protein